METRALHGLELSRLMLGTVQFGVDYGVANRGGQPAYEAVRSILECAFEGGVNCLDTAAAYGSSEEVLGRALEELEAAERVAVVSKVRPLPDDLTAAEADKEIEESVSCSLRKLKLEKLSICLFHREENARYLESLQRLQAKGWIENIGVSALTVAGAEQAMASPLVGAVQIPGNALDRRFLGGIPSAARERGVGVFVRSVFLQGLMLMPESQIMVALAAVVPVRRRLQGLAEGAGLTLAELAVRYVLSCEGVSCVLVGVDSVEQMRVNLGLFGGNLDAELVRAIEAAVPVLPDEILNPFQWPTRE